MQRTDPDSPSSGSLNTLDVVFKQTGVEHMLTKRNNGLKVFIIIQEDTFRGNKVEICCQRFN